MANNKMLGIVFSNMHDDSLHELTANRTTASVPFGGRYRLVDFTLSNMVNSGMDEVGIITKSNYHSLMDHVGAGKEWDLARKRGGLTILPPFVRSGSGVYRGTMEALSGITSYIRSSNADYVLISDCCVVANIDGKKCLEAHRKSGAEITVFYIPGQTITSPKDQVGMRIDPNGFLNEVELNPENGSVQNTYANIAIMEKELLLRQVASAVSQSRYSLVGDVLPLMAASGKAYCVPISENALAINDMQSYFNANMKLLDGTIRAELFNPARPIYTKVRDQVPAKYGLSSQVTNSLVADGCIIEGEVKNSVIFRGVYVGKGTKVENCVLMQGTRVGENASLNYVVTDKNVLIQAGRKLAGHETYPFFVPKGQRV